MKHTLGVLWVALKVTIACASLQTLVLVPCTNHVTLKGTTTAAATHAAVGQQGSFHTLFICSEPKAFPRKKKRSAAASQCHLPSALARWSKRQAQQQKENEWVLLIGPNFTFNQSIAPRDFLGAESFPHIAITSTHGMYLPLIPQETNSNDLARDLFGTRQPPGPRNVDQQHSVDWEALLDSSSVFLLIKSQDLMHLAPKWKHKCVAEEKERRKGTSHDIAGGKSLSLLERAYDAAATELSIRHLDASQVINKAPPAYRMVYPPAMLPQGAPEPLQVFREPTAPYSVAPLVVEKIHTRFGIRVVYRDSGSNMQQGVLRSSNMHTLWTTQHTLRVEESGGSIQVIEERSLFLPSTWIVVGLWLAVVVVLVAYELHALSD